MCISHLIYLTCIDSNNSATSYFIYILILIFLHDFQVEKLNEFDNFSGDEMEGKKDKSIIKC